MCSLSVWRYEHARPKTWLLTSGTPSMFWEINRELLLSVQDFAFVTRSMRHVPLLEKWEQRYEWPRLKALNR